MARAGKEAREKLKNIIEACKDVEAGKIDPFSIPVEHLIEAIRALFPLWDKPEDLILDAEALEAISGVIRAQSEWVKDRSTRLYRDPFLIEEKLGQMDPEELANIFLRAWHPVVELEQLTTLGLEMALKYWSELPGKAEGPPEARLSLIEPVEVAGPGLVPEEEIQEALEALWLELKEAARGGWARYWDFITADTYAETAKRAYLTSFLITYGYASLGVDPLEGELVLKPRRRPRRKSKEKITSLVIPLAYEEWLSHVGQEG